MDAEIVEALTKCYCNSSCSANEIPAEVLAEMIASDPPLARTEGDRVFLTDAGEQAADQLIAEAGCKGGLG